MAEMNDGKYPLPTGWRWVRLGEICDLNPRRPANIHRPDDAPTTFVPMIALDEQMGTIARPEVKPYAAIRKGYTYFEEGDVLFAKITPCMQNGKHAIARNLLDGLGFGTTEFHVLRPGADIAAEWIHRFLRQPSVLAAATTHFTGAVGQRRLPEGYLANLDIPLPPLAEQRRIAAILNEQMAAVERARAAAEAQFAAARELQPAYLREVFEGEGAQQWPRKRFGDLCKIVAQQVDPKTPEYGALPHVNGENIKSGTLRLKYLNTASEDKMTSGKYLFEPGDVLYSKLRPYLRKVTVVDFRGLCSADMYPIRVNPRLLDRHFTAWALVSDRFTAYADEESRRARMPKLNREQLFAWECPLPPMPEQQRIATFLNNRVSGVQQLSERLQSQLDAINRLPAALLRRAFSGEL